jgi:hypothetical protein
MPREVQRHHPTEGEREGQGFQGGTTTVYRSEQMPPDTQEGVVSPAGEFRRSDEEYQRFHKSYLQRLDRKHAEIRELSTTGHPIEEAGPTPAEVAQEARQEIIAMMREARPRSWQARAISQVVRWYGTALRHENELPGDYYTRRYREKGRIELIMERNIGRSPEYETERDFAMLLIEGYTTARVAELKQHGTTPAPDILQGLVAQELKDMKKLAKVGNSTVIFTPQEKPV